MIFENIAVFIRIPSQYFIYIFIYNLNAVQQEAAPWRGGHMRRVFSHEGLLSIRGPEPDIKRMQDDAQGERIMTAGMGQALSVRGLSKAYGHHLVLHDLSFELPAGETLSVIGPSGSGKSTLLSLLANLEIPSGGSILYNDMPFTSPGRGDGRIAVILQDYGLFPWKTVEENISLPLQVRGLSRSKCRSRTLAMLEELKLSGLNQRYPAQLSGGQRQRVAIGRALITDPEILLMDEPFSSLDALTREHLQKTVLDLWQRHRPTCVLVTHSVSEAVFLGTQVLVLGGSPACRKLWLRNPCFGDADCRTRDAYFSLTRQVYAALDLSEVHEN